MQAVFWILKAQKALLFLTELRHLKATGIGMPNMCLFLLRHEPLKICLEVDEISKLFKKISQKKVAKFKKSDQSHPGLGYVTLEAFKLWSL